MFFNPWDIDDVMLGVDYRKLEINTLTDEFVFPKFVITQIYITLLHIRNHLLENGHF